MSANTFAASVAFGIARGWIRPPEIQAPQPITTKKARPYERSRRAGKNIAKAREWIAVQPADRKFDYRTLHRETGIGMDACKYLAWALLQKGELRAMGKSGHHNTPMQYVRSK